MKTKVVLGCDPGQKGYIAILSTDKKLGSFIPNNLPPYNLSLKLKELEQQFEVVGIGIEKVHAIQGTSAGSNFKFGYNVGIVNALLSTLDCSLYEITPKQWQKHIGLTIPKGLTPRVRKNKIKQGVADICSKLYPSINILGPRGGLIDGKSDSLCIAHTVMEKHHLNKL